jgi:hypothetical protein
MSRNLYVNSAIGGAAVAAIVLGGMLLISAPQGNAASDNSESTIQAGLAIAPPGLNLAGKNRAWVAEGSYLVNAVGGCNDCHTNPSYAAGHNPFLGQIKQVNWTVYLGGGRLFIPAHPPSQPVVSRNLTPDKTGRPLGGASLEEFRSILRTGLDPDHAHPEYGPLLQVMPWPVYQSMTDNDIRSIYEYLSAIPCVDGDPGLPNPRQSGTRCK